ncbi:MAG: hypothetical protein KDC98_23045 [Planctomycetes bacterium]|nr:hypothetical protein [Planctomycetota bacterium]
MARAVRKDHGGATRGKFKRKRMGKGYSTARRVPIGTRPVLKITPVPAADAATPAQE